MNLSLIVDFFPNLFGETINKEDKLLKIQEPTSDNIQSTQSEIRQDVKDVHTSEDERESKSNEVENNNKSPQLTTNADLDKQELLRLKSDVKFYQSKKINVSKKKTKERNKKSLAIENGNYVANQNLQSVEQELNLYKSLLRDADRKLFAKSEKILKMEKSADESKQKIQTFEQEMLIFKGEENSAEKKLCETSIKIFDMEGSAKEDKQKIMRLEQELYSYKIGERDAEKKAMEKDHKILAMEVSAKEDKHKLHIFEQKLKEITESKNDAERNLQLFQLQLIDVEQKLCNKDNTIVGLEENAKESKERIDKLEQEVKKMLYINNKYLSLEISFKDAEQKIRSLEHELDVSRAKKCDVESELQISKWEHNLCKVQVNNAERKLQEANTKILAMETSTKEMKQKLKNLGHELVLADSLKFDVETKLEISEQETIALRNETEKILLEKENEIRDLENDARETEYKFQVLKQELKYFKLQENKAQKKVIEKKNLKIIELEIRLKDAEEKLHYTNVNQMMAKEDLRKTTITMKTDCS